MSYETDLRSTPIPEASSFTVTFDVEDEDGNAIAGASLDTLELWLYNDRDEEIINSRTAVDILNDNGGTVDGSGNGTWLGTALDSVISQPKLDIEDHTILIKWKWTPVATQKSSHHQIRLRFANMTKVPTA